MPIYAYACEACGHQMDKIQKFSDAPLVTCPECQKDTLKKQLTAPSFKLKGTGWYETDFKNNGKKPEATSKSTSETKSDTKSAVKPDAKSESKSSDTGGASSNASSSKTSSSASAPAAT